MNIVDVLAGAPAAQSAMNAVRVFRQVYVQVPDLTGAGTSDAEHQLRLLGLVPDVKKNESFFAILLPQSDTVCGTSPPAGARVAPGATVTVTVSKTC
jgi:beta-lactam-binding protein with PASTA domain